MTSVEFAVIGAGQSGLAAGYYLKRAGADFRILDGADRIGGSWPQYYDSLELFSPVRYSSLPGLAMPLAPDTYPRRDDVVRYLQDYAAAFSLPVTLSTRTESVDLHDGGFRLRQSGGGTLLARKLIVAAGAFGAPVVPQIVGAHKFSGRILHSSDYRNPTPFQGQRVVVVGAGNSAVQIAVELADKADVTLAVRNPVRFLPQKVLGRDVHWWFDKLQLNRKNLFSDHGVPVIDDGRYRRAISEGRPGSRPMFQRFSESGVIWKDGMQERIDQVIFATGFRDALGFLAKTGALAPGARPVHRKGLSTRVQGLGFVGLSGQTGFASATLRGAGPDAEHAVRRLLKG